MRTKHQPLRRCVVCDARVPKASLVRVTRTPGGDVVVDAEAKTPGRGAYVCRTPECVAEAADGTKISRTLKCPLPEQAADALRGLAEELASGSRDGR